LLLASALTLGRRPPPLPDAVPVCANLAPLYYFAGTVWDGVIPTRTADAAPRVPVPTGRLAKAHPRNAVQADGGAPEEGPDDDPAHLPAAASAVADSGMRLRDPAFVRAGADLRKQLPDPKGKRWNVVWLVLESTGLRYALGKVTPPDKPPMPYLNELAKSGWLLRRHHSTSNSSAISMVSMLSGLYPSPTHYAFATRRDIAFPSAATLLPGLSEAVLVTPGKLNYYFPHGFLKNSGFGDVEGYDDVPVKKDAVVQGTGRDEIATVDYFLRKLDALRPPYLAVYYSFVAHWDYANYGPAWRRYPSSRTLDRYLNNLWLLDNLIAHIVAHLKKTGRADDTVLVICGDHGEAFGQHEGNWSHPFAIYEENLETPAVLWQPALFQPRIDDRLTGHIDLLPTVLDAVGAPWDRSHLQGESLFQAELERKYLFGFGKDGAVFAIDPAGPKIHLPREGPCVAYDLHTDPGERRKLSCDRYADMGAAVRKWKAWQRAAIAAHSKATLSSTTKGSAAGKAPASPK
ncbi:MAG: sulfatase-like hydrolase/transferase, partial [Deltaproteobacteria bacterium]|nr:sulfatase-like hydrolase/transferase [Deltaproteobacteria bacterium]